MGKEDRDVKIIALVGMSGSGKSVAVEHLTDLGYPKVYFGGMILREMEARGIAITPENEKAFREKIRAEEGNDWVVKQVIKDAHRLIEAGQKRIVLDGVYSWTEYVMLKKEFPGEMIFIALVLPKKLRYKRVATRLERPFNRAEIIERDRSEIENLEKGGPIAAADYYILNDGTIEETNRKLDDILAEVEF